MTGHGSAGDPPLSGGRNPLSQVLSPTTPHLLKSHVAVAHDARGSLVTALAPHVRLPLLPWPWRWPWPWCQAPDWSTLAAYTCASACSLPPGAECAYVEEFVWVQPPEEEE